ncbi:MAG: hypothetical protein COV52_09575 [Gammaproteobacteria bacterium CG11_big_fil_rev_8_21_14_0_20_46_22]|nr:MAG: hypothetical protein COW05_04155 [Gammaproteobacteria bacterium CG12_big_fil_rev_8_21_14_0_65_46_12]PIR10263.1 MAG: hypothetical protein COV52_09575 [Gammaproteobacteria bacterium CG11_big_fil_rev_8_21_14_0_20_46_22]
MGIRKTIPRVKVLLNPDLHALNREILRHYQDSLKEVFPDTYHNLEKQAIEYPALKQQGIQPRDIWWVKIAIVLSKVFKVKVNTHEVELPGSSLRLSQASHIFLEWFKAYFLGRIKKDMKNDSDFSQYADLYYKDEISDPVVLVAHLYFRLMTTALCDGFCNRGSYTDLLKVMEIFTGKLVESRIPPFVRVGIILPHNRDQPQSSACERQITSGKFRRVIQLATRSIEITEQINAKKRAFSSVLEHLVLVERQLKIRIISILNPFFGSVSLVKEDFLPVSFSEEERRYLSTTKNNYNSERILACYRIKDGVGVGYEKLTRAYRLLGKAQLLLEVVGSLESLCEIVGWLPLFFGLVRLDGLTKELKEYYAECDGLIYVGKNDPLKLKKKRFRPAYEIVKHAISLFKDHVDLVGEFSYTDIKDLQKIMSEDLLVKLRAMALGHIRNIIIKQREIGIVVVDEGLVAEFCKMMNPPSIAIRDTAFVDAPSIEGNCFKALSDFLDRKSKDKNDRRADFDRLCQTMRGSNFENILERLKDHMRDLKHARNSSYANFLKGLLFYKPEFLVRAIKDFDRRLEKPGCLSPVVSSQTVPAPSAMPRPASRSTSPGRLSARTPSPGRQIRFADESSVSRASSGRAASPISFHSTHSLPVRSRSPFSGQPYVSMPCASVASAHTQPFSSSSPSQQVRSSDNFSSAPVSSAGMPTTSVSPAASTAPAQPAQPSSAPAPVPTVLPQSGPAIFLRARPGSFQTLPSRRGAATRGVVSRPLGR